MAQQINLLDARFVPRRERFTAAQTALLVALAVAGAVGAGTLARREADAALAAARVEQQRLGELRARLAPLAERAAGAEGGELARLKAADALHQRQLAVFEAATSRRRDPPSAALLALARQASTDVWLTSFAVDDSGDMTIEGRMLESGALPQHLLRLNAEPQFAGRPFTQLDMQRNDLPPDHPGTPSLLEFRLRSTAQPAAAASAPAAPATPPRATAG